MPNIQDENQKRFTVTVYEEHGNETFNDCTEVESNDRQLVFTDRNGKSHEFFGVGYHIAQE